MEKTKQFLKEITKLEADSLRLQLKKQSKISELRSICDHKNTAIHTENFSSGYDYVSEHITQETCLICGKILNEKIEYGSSFG